MVLCCDLLSYVYRTRGNIVISEVYDHTSVIKLIETRFNITCPNISPWRRAVTGDMTAAFDFDHPDYTWPVLPDTKEYTKESIEQCKNLPYPVVPQEQTFPVQETGVRVSRALPYEFVTADTVEVSSNTISIHLTNTGLAGAAFTGFNLKDLETGIPQKYAVESGKSIDTSFAFSRSDASYGVSLLGPNGFFRQFYGDDQCSQLSAYLAYEPTEKSVAISVSNSGSGAVEMRIVDNAYGLASLEFTVNAGETVVQYLIVSQSGNWYDFTVAKSDSDCFSRRFGGRMETGEDTITDPAMGNAVPDIVGLGKIRPTSHPNNPDKLRHIARVNGSPEKAAHKDELWEYIPPDHFEL